MDTTLYYLTCSGVANVKVRHTVGPPLCTSFRPGSGVRTPFFPSPSLVLSS